MNIYYCATDGFSEREHVGLVSDRRRQRLVKYKFEKDRLLSLVAGILCKKFLGDDYEEHIAIGEHGKPIMRDGRHFNLSHSGKYVLIGVCKCEIGVDVERVRGYSAGVAKRCFTSSEMVFVLDGDESVFFGRGGANEGLLMGRGLGFSFPPSEFTVLPLSKPCEILGQSWQLYFHSISGYEMCAATRIPVGDVQFCELSVDDVLRT